MPEKNHPGPFRQVREEIGLLIAVGLGIFLFILFFQPFPFVFGDFNNSILVIAGFGAVIFVSMAILRLAFAWANRQNENGDHHPLLPSYLHGFMLLIVTSVAFAFYLRYVALVELNFYLVVKAVIICLIPPLVEKFYYLYRDLQMEKARLENEAILLHEQVEKSLLGNMDKKIEFFTEHGRENLVLLPTDVACIRSADNYVEIIYREEGQFRKMLTRNTLRNIEQMLKPWPVFVRCHRTCLINVAMAESLLKKYGNHHIILKGYHEEFPVARQYVYRLKDAIDKDQGRIPFATPE